MYGDREHPAETHALRFTGDGFEYFRIWIVNVLLSLLTLGIYSAWAKVRNRQYFYGNTHLDQASFEYTVDPVAILKGRLIVVGFFFVYGFVAEVLPPFEPVFALALLVVVPWVVVRAMSFNLRFSSYRNLHFRFAGRYGHAAAVYLLGPLAAFASLGLLWPFVVYARKKFIVENSRYGASAFEFEAEIGRFYAIYLTALGIGLASAAIGVGVLFATGQIEAIFAASAGDEAPSSASAAAGFAAFLAYGVMVFVVSVYLQTAVTNYQWQSTRLRGNPFDLQLALGPMLWIQASNLVLVILTLGLFLPFARVRISRYRIERMSLTMLESIGTFVATESERLGAAGEEFGDALDLDLGL